MKDKITFEKAMNRLEEIARSLEAGEVELEASIKMYEEGVELIEFCQTKLEEAAGKVQKLTRLSDGSFETTDLDSAEDLPQNNK